MRLIRAEHRNESIMVRFVELSKGWAWTATIVGKYTTYSTQFYGGFATEQKAAENFFASVDQLIAGCMTRDGLVGVSKHMSELLVEVYGAGSKVLSRNEQQPDQPAKAEADMKPKKARKVTTKASR